MNNLKKIKMVVVDIDGTILPKNFQLSENVKKSFKKLVQNGIKTILSLLFDSPELIMDIKVGLQLQF